MKTVRALVVILALMVFVGFDGDFERMGNQFPDGNNGGGASDQNVNWQ